mgnify:CR=1 FL=1
MTGIDRHLLVDRSAAMERVDVENCQNRDRYDHHAVLFLCCRLPHRLDDTTRRRLRPRFARQRGDFGFGNTSGN